MYIKCDDNVVSDNVVSTVECAYTLINLVKFSFLFPFLLICYRFHHSGE